MDVDALAPRRYRNNTLIIRAASSLSHSVSSAQPLELEPPLQLFRERTAGSRRTRSLCRSVGSAAPRCVSSSARDRIGTASAGAPRAAAGPSPSFAASCCSSSLTRASWGLRRAGRTSRGHRPKRRTHEGVCSDERRSPAGSTDRSPAGSRAWRVAGLDARRLVEARLLNTATSARRASFASPSRRTPQLLRARRVELGRRQLRLQLLPLARRTGRAAAGRRAVVSLPATRAAPASASSASRAAPRRAAAAPQKFARARLHRRLGCAGRSLKRASSRPPRHPPGPADRAPLERPFRLVLRTPLRERGVVVGVVPSASSRAKEPASGLRLRGLRHGVLPLLQLGRSAPGRAAARARARSSAFGSAAASGSIRSAARAVASRAARRSGRRRRRLWAPSRAPSSSWRRRVVPLACSCAVELLKTRELRAILPPLELRLLLGVALRLRRRLCAPTAASASAARCSPSRASRSPSRLRRAVLAAQPLGLRSAAASRGAPPPPSASPPPRPPLPPRALPAHARPRARGGARAAAAAAAARPRLVARCCCCGGGGGAGGGRRALRRRRRRAGGGGGRCCCAFDARSSPRAASPSPPPRALARRRRRHRRRRCRPPAAAGAGHATGNARTAARERARGGGRGGFLMVSLHACTVAVASAHRARRRRRETLRRPPLCVLAPSGFGRTWALWRRRGGARGIGLVVRQRWQLEWRRRRRLVHSGGDLVDGGQDGDPPQQRHARMHALHLALPPRDHRDARGAARQ